LITGIAILGTWLYKVSPDSKAAPDQPLLARSGEEPEPKYVGGITGSAGCRWADPQDVPSAAVPLGRKYELASGLVEISYHSGAKVILQGPCRYEVDSAAGGFLSLGKLTARVETQGEGGRGKAEEAGVGAAVQLPHQPGAEESPFPLLPSAFVIRTPTAIVTDLGTEFGVEVNREGATTSHVFRGSVKVQLAAGGRPQERREVVLRENESARVQRGQDAGGPRLDFRDVGSQLPNFVRRLAEPPKELDLLDIVAGGDGTGHRREAGLDPTTGMRDTWFAPQDRWGDGKYRPVPWQPLLDGVFVPPGDGAPVALDSAGHTFAGFRNTNGHVWASIWARAAEVKPDNRAKDPSFWIYAIGASRQFMPEGCGLLAFHANGGVTFNLETMRQVHEGVRPARFQAVAAVASAHRVSPTQNDGAVDLWVFVDGRLVQKRIDLGPEQGPVRLDVSLRPADRFLTLVVTGPGTDGGGGWFVLGDPLLQMTPMASEKPAKNGPQPEGGASMNGP
jgi:hypothetical protein